MFKTSKILFIAIIFVVGSMIISADVLAAGTPPTAEAGPDKEVYENNQVTLDGSASDPDSSGLTYKWSCNGGSLSGANTLTPTFSAPSVSEDTTYICTLSVSDGESVDRDGVNVLVKEGSSNNPPEITSITGDTEVSEGGTVSLSASVDDADEDNLRYSWSCNKGSVSDSYSLNTTFNAPSVSSDTNVICTFTVRDRESSDSDNVNILVKDSGVPNVAPTADAGGDLEVYENNQISLSGSASDPDSSNLRYSWSCNGGSLSDSDTLSPVFDAPSVLEDTTYICTLSVSDGDLSDSDSVNVLVKNRVIPELVVVTDVISSVDTNSARLNGEVRDFGGDNKVDVWFEYGTTDSYGNTTPKVSLSNPGSFKWDLSNLSEDTSYHFRAVAENFKGVKFGVDREFRTDSDSDDGGGSNTYYYRSYYPSGERINNPPNIDAGSILNIVENESKIIEANSYDPEGDRLTYDWSCDGGSLSNSHVLKPVFYAPSVSEDETYHCNVTVEDEDNNVDSDSMIIFVKDSVTKARVDTKEATKVTNSTAILNGQIKDLGGGDEAKVWFEWGRTDDYGNITQKMTRNKIGEFSVELKNLVRDGIYNFRAVIENEKGVYYGGNRFFKTKDEDYKSGPVVDAGLDREVFENESVTLSGSAYDSDGRITINSWGCLRGTLVNGNSKNPTYKAPSVTKNIYDTCVFSATDNDGMISSDSMVVLVKNSGYTGVQSLIDIEDDQELINVEKWVRNISRGDDEWVKGQVEAHPSDVLEFKIEISSDSGKVVRDISVKDNLPIEFIFQNDLKVDGRSDVRNLTENEVGVGDLAPGKTREVVFSVKLKSKENFEDKTTNLINSAMVFNDQDSESDTASVLVKKPVSLFAILSLGLLGGCDVSTLLIVLFAILVLVFGYLFYSKRLAFVKRVDIE